MEVSVREILRYLRMKEADATPELRAQIEKVTEKLNREIRPRSVTRRLPCRVTENEVSYEGCTIPSRNLARHLRGCREVILFAATLGPAPDRLVQRLKLQDSAQMVIVQAAATAMIEAYCNAEQSRLSAACREAGLYLKPRFSPGYGDCPLSCQKDLFRYLDISKQIGVSLTSGSMMVPTKSVTAWIGVTEEENCYVGKCSRCPNRNCEFREEEHETA